MIEQLYLDLAEEKNDTIIYGKSFFRVKFNIYQSVVDFSRIVYFTWRVSDCEELVGVTHRR